MRITRESRAIYKHLHAQSQTDYSTEHAQKVINFQKIIVRNDIRRPPRAEQEKDVYRTKTPDWLVRETLETNARDCRSRGEDYKADRYEAAIRALDLC